MVTSIEETYNLYIAALNTTPLPSLAPFVATHVTHNSHPLTLTGYEDMIRFHKGQIPDLIFTTTIVLAAGNRLAVRIEFKDVTPRDGYLGLENKEGKRVSFVENVFYEFVKEGGGWRIGEVWSVVDEKGLKKALEE